MAGLLRDGLGARIHLHANLTPLIGEIEVTPPGVKVKSEIDMSNLRALEWHMALPGKIKQLTPLTAKVLFDPEVVPVLWTLAGKNMLMAVAFPNRATLNFWGWIDEMGHDPMSEGNRPMQNWTIKPSNLNNNCQEAPPVWNVGDPNLCLL